jgi:hypothetical protein
MIFHACAQYLAPVRDQQIQTWPSKPKPKRDLQKLSKPLDIKFGKNSFQCALKAILLAGAAALVGSDDDGDDGDEGAAAAGDDEGTAAAELAFDEVAAAAGLGGLAFDGKEAAATGAAADQKAVDEEDAADGESSASGASGSAQTPAGATQTWSSWSVRLRFHSARPVIREFHSDQARALQTALPLPFPGSAIATAMWASCEIRNHQPKTPTTASAPAIAASWEIRNHQPKTPMPK